MIILSILIENFDVIFKFLTYISLILVSMKNYNIHTFEFYDLSVLLWSFVSFSISSKQWRILKNLSINIIFPCFIVGIIMTNFFESFAQISIIKKFTRIQTNTSKQDIQYYLRQHIYAFIPMLVFTVFQALRDSNSLHNNKFLAKYSLEAMREAKGGHVDFIMIAIRILAKLVINFSRIITLSIGIFCSLVTINIPNTLLLISTLYFFWTSRFDRLLWKYFIYYHIFLMSVIYLNQVLPANLESYNHEFLSILGFSKQTFICNVELIQMNYSSEHPSPLAYSHRYTTDIGTQI